MFFFVWITLNKTFNYFFATPDDMTDQCILYPTGDNFYTTIKDYCVNLDIYAICCSFLNVQSGFKNVHIYSIILCDSFT